VRVAVDDPHRELRPGLYAAATFRAPASRFDSSRRLAREQSQERVALGLLGGPDAAFAAVLDAGVREVLTGAGLALAVPEGAVIDTGARTVVYVETMAGTFDAVEVYLGRRCGDYYPVRSGLQPGQRVAAAGAVLLDAETRLNPGVAASYFGAGSRGVAPPPEPPAPPPPSSPGPDDRELAARQKTCPVTGEDLDAMGGPVRVSVNGRTVFVCCKACVKPLRQKPEQYLKKLPK
jgi:YHS domain-containing protein